MKKRNNKLLASYAHAHDEFPKRDKITASEFRSIINAFTLNFINSIVQTGNSYKLPYGLGIIGIKKVSKYIKPVNWTESIRQKRIVNRKLLFTGEWMPKLFWLKKREYGTKFTFTDIWRIKWSKLAKRFMFHEAIENNNIIKYY